MKLAVLSDIHSNYHALNACVDWIEKNHIDGILFAGDYVSDCPYPQRTMELLYDLKQKYQTWFVRGNREDTMIEYHNGHKERCYSEGSMWYTLDHLTQEDISFFQSLPLIQNITIEDCPSISMAHGDCHNTRNKIYPDNQNMQTILEEMPGQVHICGHSHRQFIYKCGDKLVVNPGSVGVPVNGITKAEMAVLECKEKESQWRVELLHIPYDIDSEIQDFKESGLDQCCGVWGRCIMAILRTGRHYCEECISLVSKYAKETGMDFGDEKVWEMAAKKLGI